MSRTLLQGGQDSKCYKFKFHTFGTFFRIAAISKITNANYYIPFRKYLNYTDHEKYIVEEIKKFSKIEWFRKSNGTFAKYFSAPFAETLAVRGAAFTFNIMDFDELLDKKT